MKHQSEMTEEEFDMFILAMMPQGMDLYDDELDD